jgi:hypothetical protein
MIRIPRTIHLLRILIGSDVLGSIVKLIAETIKS